MSANTAAITLIMKLVYIREGKKERLRNEEKSPHLNWVKFST